MSRSTVVLRSPKALKHVLIACAASLMSIAASGASTKSSAAVTPLAIQDLLRLNVFFQDAALSPDGRWFAYAATGDAPSPWEGDMVGGPREVWLTVVDLKSGKEVRLGKKDTRSLFPLWSPDSRRLAYISNQDGQDGEMRLWGWDSTTGTDRRISASVLVPFDFGNGCNLVWTPDSTRIVARMAHPGSPTRLDLKHPIDDPNKSVGVFISRAPSSNGVTPAKKESNRTQQTQEVKFDLGVIDLKDGTTRVLVEGLTRPAGNMSVSPDGTHLTYPATRPDDLLTYDHKVILLNGGPSRVIIADTKSQVVRWSPDGSQLVYLTVPQFVVKAEGAYLVSLQEGAQAKLLSAGLFYDVQWSADGQSLLLVGDPHPRPVASEVLLTDSGRDTPGLWQVTLQSGALREITPAGWGRRVQRLLANPNGNTYWTPDKGRTVLIGARDLKTMRDGFWKVEVNSGQVHLLQEADKRYSFNSLDNETLAISQDGSAVLYKAQSAQQPEDVWISSSDFRKAPRRVTSLNPQLDRYTFGSGRLIHYRSSGTGEELTAGLILPAGYVPGQRYPLIVDVYPGNHSLIDAPSRLFYFASPHYEHVSAPPAQLFATRGYAVLYPAVPQRVGTPMRDIADAVLPAIDEAIELGIADPDRLGIRGHSYGGYATLAMIVQSTRFKAAVESAGPGSAVSTWFSMLLDDGHDIPARQHWAVGQGRMSGSFWQNREQYFENSPLYYLDRTQTPLLMLHGTLDPAVPVWMGDGIYAGLQSLGKEVEYRRYVGEYHGLRQEKNVVDGLNATLRWFDTYLKESPPAVTSH